MFDAILVCTFLMFLWNIVKLDTSDISSMKVSKSNVQADHIAIFSVENIHISLATGWHLSSLEYLQNVQLFFASCLLTVTFTLSAIPQTTSVAHMCVYIYMSTYTNILIKMPRSCMSWHLHLKDHCKSYLFIIQKNMGYERFVILWFTITPAWNHANDWSNGRFPAMIQGKEG